MKTNLLCVRTERKNYAKLRTCVFSSLLILLAFIKPQTISAVNQQTITLELSRATASELIERIGEVSRYRFAADAAVLEGIPRRNYSFRNATIAQVMSEMTAGTDLQWSEYSGTITISTGTSVQAGSAPFEIRGRVTDPGGAPLPGANIIVENTTNGTTTERDGSFRLRVPSASGKVVVSFLGYTTQTINYRAGDFNMQVRLQENASDVGEVVITGYQVINRRKLTSAVSSVSMDDLRIPGVNSIDKLLEGQIPGLMLQTNSGEVSSVPRIRVRGTSTIIGNREPLWVIDGIVLQDPVPISSEELNDPDYINRIGNAISGINPQDIERLDVLKDATATALYGAKAANGVIVITTKRGTVGKPVVNYSMTTTYRQRPRYSDRNINLMDSRERVNLSRQLMDDGYKYQNDVTWVGYEEVAQKYYNGLISFAEFQKEVGRLENNNTDWFKLVMRDTFSTSHNISISGGTDAVRYYTSVNYVRDNDVVRNDYNQTYSARSNVDINLSPKFMVSFSLQASNNKKSLYQSSIAPVNYAYNTSRAIPAYDDNGYYAYYNKLISGTESYDYNILNELEHSSEKQEGVSTLWMANVMYKPVQWLTLRGIASYDFANTENRSYWGERTNRIAQMRTSNYGDPFDASRTQIPMGGELTENLMKSKASTFRFQADLQRQFGVWNQHSFHLMLGTEASSNRYIGTSSVYRGYLPERGKKYAVFESGLYPYLDRWLHNNKPTHTDNLTNLVAGFAAATYSWKELTATANMRIDGSNKFGDQSNEKLLPVWSISAAYDFSKLLNEVSNIFDIFILKTSYGFQGNYPSNQSPVTIIKKGGYDGYYKEYTSNIDIYPNPKLRWEKTSSYNAGIELGILKNRLMVQVDYYNKVTNDAFMNQEIPAVNGMTSYVVNGGNLRNRGIDVGVSATPVRLSDFRWHLSTTFSFVKNKVRSAPEDNYYNYQDFLNGNAIIGGQSISSFYSYRFRGLDPEDGGPLFYDMQDQVEQLYGMSSYDLFQLVFERSGRREPRISAGVNNTFIYKNFRLNINLAYSLGAKTRLFKLYEDNNVRIRPENNLHKDYLNRWQRPGDENYTDIPAIFIFDSWTDTPGSKYNRHYSGFQSGKMVEFASTHWQMYNYSDIRVVNANYLKCTNLSLTYMLPDRFLDKIGFSRFEVSLSTTNPFIITSKKLKGQTPVQGGFTNISLSERPTVTIGLNVSF